MARFLLRIALLVAAVPVLASTSTQQRAAPSFPRERAHRIVPNVVGVEAKDFARPPSPDGVIEVWDVTWERGRSTGMRQRRHDQLTVMLSDGAVKVTRPDKSWTIEHRKAGGVAFDSKGAVDEQEGVSDPAARALVVEFVSYDEVPRFEKSAIAAAKAKGMEPQFPRKGSTRLFENERIIVWDDTYPLGVERELHAHFHTTIGMFIQAGEGEHTPVNTIYTLGMVNFSPPRLRSHRDRAVKGPPRGIFVEFKP